MLDPNKLKKQAATIMAHLEGANITAMEIQGHGKSLTDIAQGFETIRLELGAINNTLSKIDVLLPDLASQ